MHLYLFDIDGTLLHSGGAGRRAIEAAIRRVWGLRIPAEAYAQIVFHGRTDPVILRDAALAAGVSEAQYVARYDDLMASYLECLSGEIELATNKCLYPGVPELLDALAAESNVALGLLTGNLEAGARAKLAPFGLNRYFATGGFGSDSADRREIARLARARCEAHVGKTIPPERVVVVGDTPADVDCARAAGFCVVAVATGIHRPEDLRPLAPDLLFDDFSDTATVTGALFARFIGD